jgi:hypothetical protein
MPRLNPGGVGGDVVDAVGQRQPSSGMRKSWKRTGSGSPLRRSSRPPFLKSPTSSFFLVSTEIVGSSSVKGGNDRGVDVPELGVAIRAGGALARLAVCLQAEAQVFQQAPDQLVAVTG